MKGSLAKVKKATILVFIRIRKMILGW